MKNIKIILGYPSNNQINWIKRIKLSLDMFNFLDFQDEYIYTGEQIKPSVVYIGNDNLIENVDYYIRYDENKNVQTGGQIQIISIGNNTKGQINKSFKITKAIVQKPQFEIPTLTYNGSAQSVGISPTDYYIVSPETITEVGTYNIQISLVDPNNYKWDDDGDDLTFSITVNPENYIPPIVTPEEETFTFDPKSVYILKYSDDSDVTSVKVDNMSYSLSNTQNNGKCVGLFYYSGATKTISPKPESIIKLQSEEQLLIVNLIGANTNIGQYPGNGIFYIESSHNIVNYEKASGTYSNSYWGSKWINFGNSSLGIITVDSNEGLTPGTGDYIDTYILPGYFYNCSGYGSVHTFN